MRHSFGFPRPDMVHQHRRGESIDPPLYPSLLDNKYHNLHCSYKELARV